MDKKRLKEIIPEGYQPNLSDFALLLSEIGRASCRERVSA